jgi:hypothetical protein
VVTAACIAQGRFERPAEDVVAREGRTDLWWVPVTYTSQPEFDFVSTRPRLWLDPAVEETNLTDNFPGPDHWVIFNVQASGQHTRVNPKVSGLSHNEIYNNNNNNNTR